MAATILGLSFCEGIIAAFYPNWPSYRAESKSWECLGLLRITSWTVLLSLTVYSISFTILGMSLLVSHWQQRRFQCGRWLADRVIAVLIHGWLRGIIEAALERSRIVHWKQLWWLPSFPALAGPHSRLVKTSLESVCRFSIGGSSPSGNCSSMGWTDWTILSTQWRRYRCCTPFPIVLVMFAVTQSPSLPLLNQVLLRMHHYSY